MRRALFAAAVMLAALQPAQAAPQQWNGPLSRAQAIARATSAGFDVRMAMADAASARGQAIGQYGAVLPQVAISGNHINAHLPQFGMPEAVQTYASVTASVPLFNLAGYSGVRAGRLSADAASADFSATVNDAALNAVKAYDRALLGAAAAQAQQVAVSDQETNVRLVELRVRTGKMPRYELARARAALAQAQQMAEDAAAERDESSNDLKLLLDFDMMSTLIIPDKFETSLYTDTLGAVTQRALKQQPAVLAARLRYDAARAALDQAREAYAPTAAVTGQTYNGNSNPQLGSSGGQVGVSVTLPIVDGGTRHGALVQASAGLTKTEADFERQQLMVQVAVANAWRELDAAHRNLQTAQAALDDASESLRVARLRQQAGKGTQLEVLDALAVAANSRLGVLHAQERYDVAIAGVHHAAADPW
ncbi:MAG: TolC family protein [Candidatus Eremiobacteraeota bacterium]|nr:TolC family protein [Candidatus Eremiobacteraeota bacterium]